MEEGFVQIFGGEGKGKTGAAIGQGIKAASAGKSVVIIQFLKGKDTGARRRPGSTDTGIDQYNRL